MTHKLASNENFDIVRGNQTVRVPFSATEPQSPTTVTMATKEDATLTVVDVWDVEGLVLGYGWKSLEYDNGTWTLTYYTSSGSSFGGITRPATTATVTTAGAENATSLTFTDQDDNVITATRRTALQLGEQSENPIQPAGNYLPKEDVVAPSDIAGEGQAADAKATHDQLEEKAAKPATFTEGNLAELDNNGNPKDSGIASTNIATKTWTVAELTNSTNLVHTTGNELINGHKRFGDAATIGTTRATGTRGAGSFVQGNGCLASGDYSSAQGLATVASAPGAHAEGEGTKALNQAEHSEGKYNVSHTGSTDAAKTMHSIGFGTADNARTNAVETMQDGKTYVYGLGGYNGTNPAASGVKDLATAVEGKLNKSGGAMDITYYHGPLTKDNQIVFAISAQGAYIAFKSGGHDISIGSDRITIDGQRLALTAPNSTAGNLAALDASGNPTNSGKSFEDIQNQIDTEAPLVARSFTVQQQTGWTDGEGNSTNPIYFRPRYFGMKDGDLFKGIVLRTRDSGLTPFTSGVYMRIKRYSDGQTLGVSELTIWPNTANTDVAFRFPQAIELPSSDNYYTLDFSETPNGAAVNFGMRLYVTPSGSSNPDFYFNVSSFVPVATAQFYSWEAFDDTPTAGSTNPVTSDGIAKAVAVVDAKAVAAQSKADAATYAAQVAGNAASDAQGQIAAVKSFIPSGTTPANKLVDTATMNSSIATNTATFRGTYNLVTDLELTVAATQEQIAVAISRKMEVLSISPDNNDYCFVQIPTKDETPTEISRVDRYKCVESEQDGVKIVAWEYEWSLNNSSFTADQWAAINSGITSGAVAKLDALPTAQALAQSLANKLDKSGGTASDFRIFLGNTAGGQYEWSFKVVDGGNYGKALVLGKRPAGSTGSWQDERAYLLPNPDAEGASTLALLTDIYAAVQQIAPAFDATRTAPTKYKQNELVSKDGVVYQCTNANGHYGAWDAGNWEAKPVSELFLPLTGGEMTGNPRVPWVVFTGGGGVAGFGYSRVNNGFQFDVAGEGSVLIRPNASALIELNAPKTSGTLALTAGEGHNGNLAKLDANGNPVDSGKSLDDISQEIQDALQYAVVVDDKLVPTEGPGSSEVYRGGANTEPATSYLAEHLPAWTVSGDYGQNVILRNRYGVSDRYYHYDLSLFTDRIVFWVEGKNNGDKGVFTRSIVFPKYGVYTLDIEYAAGYADYPNAMGQARFVVDAGTSGPQDVIGVNDSSIVQHAQVQFAANAGAGSISVKGKTGLSGNSCCVVIASVKVTLIKEIGIEIGDIVAPDASAQTGQAADAKATYDELNRLANALEGSSYDFSTNRDISRAVADIVRLLGGEVTNVPSENTGE